MVDNGAMYSITIIMCMNNSNSTTLYYLSYCPIKTNQQWNCEFIKDLPAL